MKPFFVILLVCSCSAGFCQNYYGADTALKFDKRYTQCERKWVVRRPDGTGKYDFGFIYIDSQAGFTFDFKGNFILGENNKYIVDTSISHNTSIKALLYPKWGNVAILAASHFNELGIKPQPDWIGNYYHYTDTLAHNFRWGFIYNDVNQCDTALVYLNKVYALQPHYKGLEFELIFAHNALNDYDGTINIVTTALEADAINPLLYRELGYAYMKEKNYFKAINAYKTGINLCTADTQLDTKAEMAINLAEVYKSSGSDDDFKLWGKLAKSWARPDTEVYNFIVRQGF